MICYHRYHSNLFYLFFHLFGHTALSKKNSLNIKCTKFELNYKNLFSGCRNLVGISDVVFHVTDSLVRCWKFGDRIRVPTVDDQPYDWGIIIHKGQHRIFKSPLYFPLYLHLFFITYFIKQFCFI